MTTEPAPTPKPKPTAKERLKKLYDDYGTVAITTYFSLSFLTWLGFTLAIGLVHLLPTGQLPTLTDELLIAHLPDERD